MSHKCVVCGNSRTRPLYSGLLLRCQECGHVFADLTLTSDEIRTLYGSGYFFGGEYLDYLNDRSVLQKNFRLRLKVLRSFLVPARHKHLLEIGSAYGFFLDMAKDSFISATGIDVSKEGTRYAREQLKLEAINEDFLKYDFGKKKFDLVCMWDTIEHLSDPHLVVERLGRIMGSGSLLAITTGDINSLNAIIKKKRWRLIHPPTHVHYFSGHTLGLLLSKNGFEIIYNKHCGFYRSIGNIVHSIFVLHKSMPRLYALLKRFCPLSLSCYCNLYDIMYIVARKC